MRCVSLVQILLTPHSMSVLLWPGQVRIFNRQPGGNWRRFVLDHQRCICRRASKANTAVSRRTVRGTLYVFHLFRLQAPQQLPRQIVSAKREVMTTRQNTYRSRMVQSILNISCQCGAISRTPSKSAKEPHKRRHPSSEIHLTDNCRSL